MSGAAEARELEERLREAAALGDVAEVRRLLGAGADIDSRNEINGWTCLHWACKRNHAQVVSCLLEAGADKQILTAKGELAAQLTSKPDIRKILGELVLKVRVQNLRDNDFIEIELDRQELTYQDLLRVSCCELGVNPEEVEKIRKLPNTLLRKDKDVARLQDFQELELVLTRSDSSPFRNTAAALMEQPCYNSRASKLTY
ncbi:putative ANKRD40 C-terminal-like protein isoform X2 [Agelaius tricolor]|uniref:putative ANKRD40 C-terminal-like protein isoform X2 n=1 Tax=Agelaius phoeniceus TaxID=39638 RepID=UPI0023EBFFD7|nr:ankyrin repeat domain-containing protein 40-like isoform X2 [Agelaius phoeniceus]